MASSANNHSNESVSFSRDVQNNPSVETHSSAGQQQELSELPKESELIKESKHLLDDGFKVEKQKSNPSMTSTISNLPCDDDQDNEETPDSQIELSMAFDGGNRPSSNAFKRRKKKLIKKRSDKKNQRLLLSSSQVFPVPLEVQTSVIPNEFAVNKLERIYKPGGEGLGADRSQADNLNVRVMSKRCVDISDYEKQPSCTEYYIRTVDPNHNNFEMTSQGVQTDWSWLRDKSQDNHELDNLDIDKVMERLKFGLYGGFGPANPGEHH